jgi:hypothetical protein
MRGCLDAASWHFRVCTWNVLPETVCAHIWTHPPLQGREQATEEGGCSHICGRAGGIVINDRRALMDLRACCPQQGLGRR